MQRAGGEMTARQNPVKLRGRQIEILRDLLELGPINASQLVRTGEHGNDGFRPANQTAASRELACVSGNILHWEVSQGSHSKAGSDEDEFDPNQADGAIHTALLNRAGSVRV